ncbi:hypothetical protein CPB86DRAFT_827746 [Serendipita vermifera]|nr:hypothetical protein CPB86DRAFT_827746 [Serendipita vermifera]
MSRSLRNTTKQYRWLVLGGGLTWYTHVLDHLPKLLERPQDTRVGHPQEKSTWPWSRISGWTSVSLGILTILVFLYLLVLPRFTGRRPQYSQWQSNQHLRVMIPLLTGTIFFGWTSLVLTLFWYSEFNLFVSFLALLIFVPSECRIIQFSQILVAGYKQFTGDQ